jgi:hypothetical protein
MLIAPSKNTYGAPLTEVDSAPPVEYSLGTLSYDYGIVKGKNVQVSLADDMSG